MKDSITLRDDVAAALYVRSRCLAGCKGESPRHGWTAAVCLAEADAFVAARDADPATRAYLARQVPPPEKSSRSD